MDDAMEPTRCYRCCEAAHQSNLSSFMSEEFRTSRTCFDAGMACSQIRAEESTGREDGNQSGRIRVQSQHQETAIKDGSVLTLKKMLCVLLGLQHCSPI